MSTNKHEIAFLVDKHHVYDSNRTVLRDMFDHLKRIPANMTPALRVERKRVYTMALQIHKENRDIVREFRLL